MPDTENPKKLVHSLMLLSVFQLCGCQLEEGVARAGREVSTHHIQRLRPGQGRPNGLSPLLHVANLPIAAGETSRATSCQLTHHLPKTVPSFNHISHHTQRHASSHTGYQRQRLHSIIFLITPNVMPAHTPVTKDNAFIQSYFSSRPTSCQLTHRLPKTMPSFYYYYSSYGEKCICLLTQPIYIDGYIAI